MGSLKLILGDDDRTHRRWPAGVEGEVCDGFDQFVLGETVVDRPTEVTGDLLGAVERDESGDGDQAAVALGQAGPFPDVAEQHVVRQLHELWREVADHLLCWAGLVRHVAGPSDRLCCPSRQRYARPPRVLPRRKAMTLRLGGCTSVRWKRLL